jgi:SAM-dependent methyltransferase/uncharacterized protein YbaR (Trm112 family)
VPFNQELLSCPESGLALEQVNLAEAQARIGEGVKLTVSTRHGEQPSPFGVTDTVLIRTDNECAYPIVEDVPILLAPEMIFSDQSFRDFDLNDPSYAEAYEEMEFYNEYGIKNAQALLETGETNSVSTLNVLRLAEEGIGDFPEPHSEWLDAIFDCVAQWDAYSHFGPLTGKRVLQLGGSGIHAVKFLLAGASEAWLLTPMYGEIVYAKALASRVGVENQLHCVVGVAEELPFADESFDVIFSGGCIHHTRTEVAFPEIERILKANGRFGATDPWKAPLHSFGTKLLGKRETDVHCRPLTSQRVEPIYEAFDHAQVIHHGTFSRYPLLALHKFGISATLNLAWTLFRADDAICSLYPPLRKWGSSVALLATKGPSIL